ncbi:putative RNA-dependent RNA polymerase 5 [Cardamine amara subsp. amara]|uniref:RNA-dependent RNA polymerase 5 n=1 Tax=Cardamine amara subsp. amara TaxID=228776 RepID=A0ABD0ZL84_CARAN
MNHRRFVDSNAFINKSLVEWYILSVSDFYGAAGFKESKKSLEELYPKAFALYKISYDYAIKWNNVKYCGFVWKIAGPVLCRFYEKNPIMCSMSVLKELLG